MPGKLKWRPEIKLAIILLTEYGNQKLTVYVQMSPTNLLLSYDEKGQ